MTVDREQTRRDSDVLALLLVSDWTALYNAIQGRDPLYSALKRIEAALEQAERERDERVGRDAYLAEIRRADELDARLAKVPALVEALRKAVQIGEAQGLTDASYWLRDARAALTVWEQE